MFMNCISVVESHIRRTLAILAVVQISGCAGFTSIYRTDSLPKDVPHVISLDAKQRVLISNPTPATVRSPSPPASHNTDRSTATPGSPTNTTPNVDGPTNRSPHIVRFCVEPPPDIFTAIASSLGLEATLSESTSKDILAKLASTLSENASTIERTQTVNILREAMYRNCERYLSGAISEEEFIVQAARDQQLIIQVLAIEQITGIAKSQSTALTTVAKAVTNGITDVSITTLDRAKRDQDDKREARDRIVEEAMKLPPLGECGTGSIDENNPPSNVTTDQAKAKNAKCNEARKAEKLYIEAKDHYDLLKSTAAKAGSVSSDTLGKLTSAALDAPKVSKEIAEKVVDIVKQYQAFDEIGMTCVVQLRTLKTLSGPCEKLVQQIADTRAAQLKLDEVRLDAMRVSIYQEGFDRETLRNAQKVWDKLGRNFNQEHLKSLVKKSGIELNVSIMRRLVSNNNDFDAFVKEFKRLPLDQQRALANAAGQSR